MLWPYNAARACVYLCENVWESTNRCVFAFTTALKSIEWEKKEFEFMFVCVRVCTYASIAIARTRETKRTHANERSMKTETANRRASTKIDLDEKHGKAKCWTVCVLSGMLDVVQLKDFLKPCSTYAHDKLNAFRPFSFQPIRTRLVSILAYCAPGSQHRLAAV